MNQIERSQELEEKISREKDDVIKFVLLRELADISIAEDKLEYALEVYERALIIAEKIRNPKLKCETLIHLGDIADNLNQDELAAKYFNEALGVTKETRNFRARSNILSRLAMLSIKKDQPSDAVAYFEQALEATDIAKSTVVTLRKEHTENTFFKAADNFKPSSLTQIATEVSNQIEQGKRTRRKLYVLVISIVVFLIIAWFALSNYISSYHPISVGVVIVGSALFISSLVFLGILIFFERIFR